MDWNIIDACIQKKSLLTSDFYQAWSSGALNLDDLRFYAKQYYTLETTFPRLLSRIHSNCTRPEERLPILENLNDEEGGEHNHRELWLRFAEGLGLTREEVLAAPVHPATAACVDTLMELASHANPAVGLAALYAYESQLPAVSQSKIDGLKRFYGIDDPRTLQFFTVHQEVDVWHAQQERTLIDTLGADAQEVQTAVERSCDALLMFLAGVDQSTRLMREDAMTCH